MTYVKGESQSTDQKKFDAWYTLEKKDMRWINELPTPPATLTVKSFNTEAEKDTWYNTLTQDEKDNVWIERVYK